MECVKIRSSIDINNTEQQLNKIIQEHSLRHHWDTAVSLEAKKYAEHVKRVPNKTRYDLRDKLFVTIDGADAKDFDDAILVEEIDGRLYLSVAIADVASYIPAGGAVDREAYLRGNSVYLPFKVIPMLPYVLSNDMCSLQPNQDRLSLVCKMELSTQGNIKEYEFYPAVICSKARLTYQQVGDFLEKKRSSDIVLEVAEMLNLAYKAYCILAGAKMKRQAIQLNVPQPRIVFDDKKRPLKIELSERNEAHQLIEEFMICANVAAAKFLAKHHTPYLRRVHQGIKESMQDKLNEFLKEEMGFSLKGETNSDLNQLFERIKGHKSEIIIHRLVLQCLSRAKYAPLDTGHFGLALSQYTHFTSPIRRYPDLLIHRAIYSALKLSKTFDMSDNLLTEMGNHCSETEKQADDTTYDTDSFFKCKILEKSIGKTFNSIVTGVTNFGLFVELEGVYTSALLHVSQLGNSYYTFNAENQTLCSENGKEIFKFGMSMRVKLTRVDTADRKIDVIPDTH